MDIQNLSADRKSSDSTMETGSDIGSTQVNKPMQNRIIKEVMVSQQYFISIIYIEFRSVTWIPVLIK